MGAFETMLKTFTSLLFYICGSAFVSELPSHMVLANEALACQFYTLMVSKHSLDEINLVNRLKSVNIF